MYWQIILNEIEIIIILVKLIIFRMCVYLKLINEFNINIKYQLVLNIIEIIILTNLFQVGILY